MEAILETDEQIKKRKKAFEPAMSETDEAIKKRKKGMGSKHHSLIQLAIITQMVLNYNEFYKAVPELSLDLKGKEKIPDLSFYKKDAITYGKEEIRVKNLPLGVVEILSPTQALTDLVKKAKEYLNAGILSYWLVAPEVQSVYLYSQGDERKIYTHKDILIDTNLNIELDLSKIF
jgi:Uma2 family endonuclease